MSLTLSGNLVCWTEPFLKRLKASGAQVPPPGLVLGDAPSHDAGEFVVKAAGNRLEAPEARGKGEPGHQRGRVQLQKLLNRKFSLPAAASTEASPTRPGAASTSAGGSRR